MIQVRDRLDTADMSTVTPLPPRETDAAEDSASAGLTAVQLIFDECMARFAVLLELWNCESCAILDGKPSPSAETSTRGHHTEADVSTDARAA
jgi:hypothetical protein